MEWGIKLKIRENDLAKKTFREFIGKVIIYFVAITLLFLFIKPIVRSMDFQWVYDYYGENLYYRVRVIFEILSDHGDIVVIIAIIISMGFLALLYKLLKKIFNYINAITDSADKLFNKNEEYISLPSEMYNLEQKLNYLKMESLKNEKLAKENELKKDELIVYLAHDIKTPLTSMIGYLSLLDEINDMPKVQREKYIKTALDKSYKLEDLINELFDIARFNSEKIILEKEKLNLNLMIVQIIDDFYPILQEIDKKIILDSEDNIEIFADPDKLSRVFNNLIKNAINYSNKTSNIIISIRKDTNNAIIEVLNKGKQIPKEKLDRVFEKFYRVDSSRTTKTGGSGLGLAIAKEIVELHNGKITAKSDKEETCFCVELPIQVT